ncbi:predicted protein [Chaetomium globosum CBS 148.51]|uniref:Uncharacterized protein n=1 Tax=Chaetomium globosum (strain ATCC 6205 / CBS 148.51 / DSM 1962 / NBRC 6347 / NRRL 1970) TaxID=306901 RepID=Q2H8W8_CHAGB|nr:uncharacterized protein CHGG_03336 [Chaetomium globosum CBS 148.51]EAQ91401.1 predicted protein [Chaetomium globosum CBS 148.51]
MPEQRRVRPPAIFPQSFAGRWSPTATRIDFFAYPVCMRYSGLSVSGPIVCIVSGPGDWRTATGRAVVPDVRVQTYRRGRAAVGERGKQHPPATIELQIPSERSGAFEPRLFSWARLASVVFGGFAKRRRLYPGRTSTPQQQTWAPATRLDPPGCQPRRQDTV